MKIDGSGKGNFVAFKIDFWEAFYRTLTVEYLPPPFTRKGKPAHLQMIKDYCFKGDYELIGVIHTINKRKNFSWLVIARKRI